MDFQFPSKRWEIEILSVIEESSKTFAYFLYNLHPLFHLKVLEILFSNSRLFPHADNPLFQKISSELVEHQSDVGVGRHVELHSPIRGAVVATHHATEVLASTEGLGHVLHRSLNAVVGCGGVRRRVPILLWLPMSHQYISLWRHTSHIFSSLYIHFLTLTILIFFIQTQNFENKRISLEVFKIIRILSFLIQTHSKGIFGILKNGVS